MTASAFLPRGVCSSPPSLQERGPAGAPPPNVGLRPRALRARPTPGRQRRYRGRGADAGSAAQAELQRDGLRAGLALALGALGALAVACAPAPPAAEPAAPPPPVEARAAVDRAVATTGDLITYTVTVEHDPDLEVSLPEPGSRIAGFRIVDVGREEPKEVRGRVVEERWYRLRADLVGSYVLPPVTVAYRPAGGPEEPGAEAVGGESTPQDQEPAVGSTEGTGEDGPGAQPEQGSGESGPGAEPEQGSGESGPGAEPEQGSGKDAAGPPSRQGSVETSEIFVEVESVLPADGEAADIRDLKPLVPGEEGPPWVWMAGGGGGLLLAAAILAVWWWRRRRPRPAAPPVPAHEVAFAALDALRRTDFTDPAAVRRYYFALSEVVRSYVEARWGLNATDLTTEEIFAALDELRGLPREPAGELRRFLRETDRVKFASHRPSEPEIADAYERALSFVEATRPQPRPQPLALEEVPAHA